MLETMSFQSSSVVFFFLGFIGQVQFRSLIAITSGLVPGIREGVVFLVEQICVFVSYASVHCVYMGLPPFGASNTFLFTLSKKKNGRKL